MENFSAMSSSSSNESILQDMTMYIVMMTLTNLNMWVISISKMSKEF